MSFQDVHTRELLGVEELIVWDTVDDPEREGGQEMYCFLNIASKTAEVLGLWQLC